MTSSGNSTDETRVIDGEVNKYLLDIYFMPGSMLGSFWYMLFNSHENSV